MIKTINAEKQIDYGKDLMKIKINTDDKLPLKKLVNFPTITVIIRSVFEDGKYYAQVFLHECFMSYKMLQHEKIDVSQGIDTNKISPSKECMLCHYWYFKDIS